MVILFFGICLVEVMCVCEELLVVGISLIVVDVCFVKFLDCDLILWFVCMYDVLIIIEEGLVGGFGLFVV